MLLWLAYSGCHSVLVVSLMCVALFCNGAVTISTLTNHTDIAPNFAGTTFGIDQTLTSILSFIVPVVVGVLIDGQQTLGNWRNAFWTCVAMYTLTTIFYLFFASISVQPWNSLRGTWDVTTTHQDSVEKFNDNEEETNTLQTSVG
ncbi:hypothetical protein Pcinc_018864 [Petrolisthes cinctipes]|uniref:Inorganic phosphate cotransporter n=1 Tax=Petrolisthes cinctipes TaxID=88211 RepID=A0AAE1KL64_PETCI|nr:hypothetical protein Pcinc_018864 [Petrolisthes cinctipes]